MSLNPLKNLKAALNPRTLQGFVFSALGEGMAEFKKRVFFEGKDIAGGQIGKYSRKPFYVPVKPQGKGFATGSGSQVTNKGIKPRGKKGDGYVYGNFKNGKTRKSMYFKDGYYEFRATTQRKNDKVDLSLTNQLQNDIRLGRRGNVLTVEITTDLSTKKARGNELHFKKEIFAFSKSEAELVASEIDRLLASATRARR